MTQDILGTEAATLVIRALFWGGMKIAAVALFLALTGCHGVALMVLEGLASGATIADRVVGIDVSLQQNQPNKTPITSILVPAPAR